MIKNSGESNAARGTAPHLLHPAPGQAIPLIWLMAVLCLTKAIHANWGFYSPTALFWVGAGCLLGLFSTGVAPQFWRGRRADSIFFAVLGGILLWQIVLINSPAPLARFQKPVPAALQQAIYAGLCVGSLLALLGFWPLRTSPTFHRLRFWFMLLAHFITGVLIIRATPTPLTDVWHLQQDASHALLSGINPYGIVIPDIYGSAENYYSSALQHDGKIWFGYCYLPGSLLMALPGVALLNDHRYAQLAALSLSAALIAFSRPSRVSFAAASLFLFTPRLFFVLEQAWTEPFVLLALSLMVFCACRAPGRTSLALALLLVTKQYVVFGLPVLWLLRTRLSLRQVLTGGALAAAVTLPFVLWSPRAFWHSTVEIYTLFLSRDSALTFAVWLHRHGIAAPIWLSFLMSGGIALWLRVRWNNEESTDTLAPSLFAAGTALVWLAFFAFAKQSFCNYYFLVIGALCLAVATWPQDVAEEPVLEEPVLGACA